MIVRSSRDTMQGQGQKSVVAKSEPVWISRILPPPSRKPTSADSGMVDYFSGDVYKTERFSGASGSIHTAVPDNSNNHNPVRSPSPMLSSTPHDFINPTASMFAPKPAYKEPVPTSKSADQFPPAPWDVLSANVIPPPPSRYNRRQQFFEEQHVYGGGIANSSSGSGSYDGLAVQTQNLSIKSPTSKQEKPEDAIFKDLLDFAKAK